MLELLSATFDDQANRPDRAVAERHLGACEACRALVQLWGAVGYALRTLPAGRPSTRVDQAIARLANPPRRRLGLPAFPALAARLAIATAAIVAVILGGLPLAQTPGVTPAVQDNAVVVAAAQQIVYNAKNNTLYVLDTATAAVDAREPGTNETKVRIPIGGEPIRLTLNEVANTILVLDAVQKRVTEIDAATNMVIGATNVDVTGTPTSINVDNTGKILVTSIATPTASAAPVGNVSVLDSTTKQLETVREIDVAPRMVVVDPLSNQAVLVSATTTKLVDSSYKVIATLPGGVAAAFSRRGDGVAVLSPTGPDTTITFAGAFAPASVRLQGSPRAITALKGGGYLVLLQIDGQGRVVKISSEGRSEGSVSIASVVGGDLLYDEATNFFTVANAAGTLASAQIPGTAAAATSATPTANTATTVSTPAASSPPAASPTASPEPAKSPSASPVVLASPAASVLDGATPIASGLYSASLPSSLHPHLIAANGSRIWFIDLQSRVGTFDMNTGEVRVIAKLRSDAHVGFWVAGRSFVFGVDAASGQVHVINTVTESVDSYPTNVLSPVSAVAVGADDRLWIGLRDASYLLAFDARNHGMDSFDLLGGARVSALAIDRQGRIVYSDDLHATVGTLDLNTGRLTEVALTRQGTTTALIVDGSGTLWLGTSTGDLYSVKSLRPGLAINVRTPVSTLALDRSGRAWFLAPIPNVTGFGYAPADGSDGVRSIPGPASGLAFGEGGRAFSADPRGAFYVAAEDGR
ncbi:MAG TPA: hypothetical protein VGR85_04780 [Candidatus Limnocylindria bacterium]|nr:hypothetical protein [Candidatus Limnocylindria bacterium]